MKNEKVIITQEHNAFRLQEKVCLFNKKNGMLLKLYKGIGENVDIIQFIKCAKRFNLIT